MKSGDVIIIFHGHRRRYLCKRSPDGVNLRNKTKRKGAKDAKALRRTPYISLRLGAFCFFALKILA